MANRYMVGVTSAGADWNSTSIWSTSSGGASGASVPTSVDSVFIDDNSVSTGLSAAIISFTGDISCNDFTSNRPTGGFFTIPVELNSSSSINIYGDVNVTQHATGASAQSMFFFCGVVLKGTSTQSVDFGSPSIIQPQSGGNTTGFIFDGIGGQWTLQNTIGISSSTPLDLVNGAVILNGFDLAHNQLSGSVMNVSAGTTIDASGGGTVKTGQFNASGTSLSHIIITGGSISIRTIAVVSYATVTNNIAAQILGTSGLPFVDNNGTDGGGNTNWTFTGGTPPVANFDGNPLTGTAYLPVHFTDESTNNPTSWLWDFGDGSTSTEQNPIHIYGTTGTFTVELTATNADGSDSFTRVAYISVPTSNLYLQNVFMIGADLDGDVQTLNVGRSDDGVPIYFELETQELEFGNRLHLKKIADKIVVFTNFGVSSQLQASTDTSDYKPIVMDLSERVNIGTSINLEGHFVTFKWFGSSSETTPVFEGLYLEDVTDLGMTYG
ncbi:MAG: PKD domain-containing protein [Patescibacteria group bacterium]